MRSKISIALATQKARGNCRNGEASLPDEGVTIGLLSKPIPRPLNERKKPAPQLMSFAPEKGKFINFPQGGSLFWNLLIRSYAYTVSMGWGSQAPSGD